MRSGLVSSAMDEANHPKYAVLKWDDWEHLLEVLELVDDPFEGPTAVDMAKAYALEDAEVIRKQDITSGPVFHLYANLIRSFVDLLQGPLPITDRYDALQEIADHFHEAANEADEIRSRGGARLPD